MSAFNDNKIAFIDLEASGLGGYSFPIEFGWAFADLTGGSFLIRPHPRWLQAKSAWNTDSEQVHGISLEQLMDEGVALAEAAGRINHALYGRLLFSDSPDHDWMRWGSRIFQDSRVTPQFKVHPHSLERYMVYYADLQEIGDRDWSFAEAEAKRLVPQMHRAGPDALRHATFYHLLSLGAEELTRRREASGTTGLALGKTRYGA